MKSIIHLFDKIQQNSAHTISISGKSGTGKTTLSLQLAACLLSKSTPSCCIWIQASELFPYRRLKTIFQKDSMRTTILEKNIFVTPEYHTFRSYEEQSKFLIKLSKNMALPPHLKCMVIDNISHHLRYEISNYPEVQQIANLLDRFFEEQLFPLICFCQRESIYLFLIHESSYDPTLGRNRAFYSKLYDRIKTISIELNTNMYNGVKIKLLNLYDQNKVNIQSFSYKISQNGFLIEQL